MSCNLSNEKNNIISVLPIIKYQLKDFMNNFDISINYKDEDNLTGAGRYYAMDAIINGLDDTLLINFDKYDNTYKVMIRSMSKNLPNNHISIIINSDKIDIKSKLLFRNVINEKEIEYNNLTIINRLYKDDKLLLCNKQKLDDMNDELILPLLNCIEDNKSKIVNETGVKKLSLER
jgi:hypothetical protein